VSALSYVFDGYAVQIIGAGETFGDTDDDGNTLSMLIEKLRHGIFDVRP